MKHSLLIQLLSSVCRTSKTLCHNAELSRDCRLPQPFGLLEVTMHVRFSNRPVWGQALSGYPPLQCRCHSRARASLRNRHQGPSIMGSEDEAEQSIGRPCRLTNGRSKRTNELTSSIVPRGTPFHRLVELEFPPIEADLARLSCRCRG